MKRKNLFKILLVLIPITILSLFSCHSTGNDSGNKKIKAQQVEYKIGILGAPDYPGLEWNDANLKRMKDLGFNTLQLNIAWGYRPNDEALNLEDVVSLPQRFALPIDLDSEKTLRTPEKIKLRSEKLMHRIALCQKYGFRIMFHFGAPFVGYPPKEPLSQYISDTLTINRYVTLLKDFNKKFPGVEDLLCYTYDQNAWLGSEFGPSSLSHGIPVAERVSKFINILAQTWKKINPKGKLWWEPWELSAGETYAAMDLLDSSSVGLSIHSNIAEVQIAFPADRWFKNILIKAKDKNIPVLAELFTGDLTEEVEPYTYITCPLATLKALGAVNTAGKLKGIKEYYGNVPDREDPNLRMTGIFFHNPDITDDEALTELAKPYKDGAEGIELYWKLSSQAIVFYPWDVSWFAREAGRSDPHHLMTAAVLKGASWQTPSWQSSRRTAFMRTDETTEPNFWMIEDIQLRLEQSATKMGEAIQAGNSIKNKVPEEFRMVLNKSIEELGEFRVSVLAYVYHLRETNLANLIRSSIEMGLPAENRMKNIAELKSLLLKDQENQGYAEPVSSAIKLLNEDPDSFLKIYFLPSKKSKLRNNWTITSQ